MLGGAVGRGVGRGIKSGAKFAAGTAALGTGAFLRQAASPIPGGTAAMTAGLGLAGAMGGAAFGVGGGGKGAAGAGGKGGDKVGGAMIGGLEKLQEGITKLLEVNKLGFKDVAIIKDVLMDMRNKAYEDARNSLKNIQKPTPMLLAAANDNNKTGAGDNTKAPMSWWKKLLIALGIGGLLNAAQRFGIMLLKLKDRMIKWTKSIKGWLGEKLTNARTAFGNFFTRLKGWGTSIKGWLGEKLTNAKTSFGNLFTKLKGWGTSIKGWAGEQLTNAKASFGSLFTKLKLWGTSIKVWAGEKLTNARTSFTTFFGKGGTLSKWGTSLKEFGANNKFSNFIKGLGGMFDGLTTKLGGIFKSLGLKIPEFLTKDKPPTNAKPTNNPLENKKTNKPGADKPKGSYGDPKSNAKPGVVSKVLEKVNKGVKSVANSSITKSIVGAGQKVGSGIVAAGAYGSSKAVKGASAVAKAGVRAVASPLAAAANRTKAIAKFFASTKIGRGLGWLVKKFALPIYVGATGIAAYNAIENEKLPADDPKKITKRERDGILGGLIGGLGGSIMFGVLGAGAAVAGTAAAAGLTGGVAILGAPAAGFLGGLAGGIAGHFGGKYLGEQLVAAAYGENPIANAMKDGVDSAHTAMSNTMVGRGADWLYSGVVDMLTVKKKPSKDSGMVAASGALNEEGAVVDLNKLQDSSAMKSNGKVYDNKTNGAGDIPAVVGKPLLDEFGDPTKEAWQETDKSKWVFGVGKKGGRLDEFGEEYDPGDWEMERKYNLNPKNSKSVNTSSVQPDLRDAAGKIIQSNAQTSDGSSTTINNINQGDSVNQNGGGNNESGTTLEQHSFALAGKNGDVSYDAYSFNG